MNEGAGRGSVATESAVDRLLQSASVLVVVGAGGVGKTTMSAALACRAAVVHDRRVLVTTVDPARRLAGALGLDGLPSEPVLVPAGPGDGRLWAQMVDTARSWDRLVERLASEEDAAALLANPLYRSLTTQFIQSHDYIALDQLADVSTEDRFDLIVVDTPPATHAIDLLDAPDRMTAFFDSRLLRWLTASYRSRLVQTASRPFLAVAERLLGSGFLTRIGEFFWLFSGLQSGLVERAAAVKARLGHARTEYVLVTTAEKAALATAEELIAELDERRLGSALLVDNRSVPIDGSTADAVAALAVADGPGGDAALDPTLRAAIEALLDGRMLVEETVARWNRKVPIHTVDWRLDELSSPRHLASLFEAPDGLEVPEA